MKIKYGRVIIAMTVLSFLFLSGCSWWNKDQGPLQGDGYRKMLELQKAKAAAMNPEIDAVKKLKEPDAAEMERLGDQYIRQGNPNMAFVYYDKAIGMDPKRSAVFYKRGLLLLSRGMLNEADAEFDAILKNDANYALAHEGKGRVALARGNLEESQEQFIRALRLKEDLWQAYSFLGIISDRKQKFDVAIGYYHKAIAINPKSGDLFNNLGMSYTLAGEYEKALQAYVTAAELKQDKKNRIYANMGIALGKLGRYDEALKVFKMAGDEASAYNNLGCIYLAEEKYAEAIAAFQKAMEVNPKYYVKARENMLRAEAMMKGAESLN